MLSELYHLPDRTAWPEQLRLAYAVPDWHYWTNLADATLEELVCLSLDLDPINYLGEEREELRDVRATLALARFYSRLGIAENNARNGILPIAPRVTPYRARIKDFVSWANGLEPAWELPEALQSAADRHRRPPQSNSGMSNQWPWGDYETELLRHLAAAADKFWKNYDPEQPDTAPTNDQVADWLVSRRVKKYLAESIATILRANNLPTGRRK